MDRSRTAILVALLVPALLGSGAGCIAYRAYGGVPATGAPRASAIKHRGIIATSVGVAELAVAGAIVLASFAIARDPVSGGTSSENPAGAAGQGLKAVGARLLGQVLLGGLGATALISGIGDVACGVTDLRGRGTCDAEVRAWQLDDRDAPSPVRSTVGALGPIVGASVPLAGAAAHAATPLVRPTITPGRGIGPFQLGMTRAEVGAGGLAISELSADELCVEPGADVPCRYRLRLVGDRVDRITYADVPALDGASELARVATQLHCSAVGAARPAETYRCGQGLWVARRTTCTVGVPCGDHAVPRVTLIQTR
ncbi:MAG: hypothetical protein H6Q90_2428 [Deltaproteobacteria bacterium]|nr:hypothetical protein [Deltaproteobacteria bacterium]